MFNHFLSLQWKAFFRSASLGKSLGLKIMMGMMGLYFVFLFLMLGIGLYPLLREFYPEQEVLQTANRFVLIWLLMELALRFLLQHLPVMQVKPLLLIPVPKRKMVNYILARSLFSFFNLLPLLVVLPFFGFLLVKTEHPALGLTGWAVTVVALSLGVNFANFLLKRKFADNFKGLLPYLFAGLLLYGLEYSGVFSLSTFLGSALDEVVLQPLLALIPVFILLGLLRWNQRHLEKRFYLDEVLKGKSGEADVRDFGWARRFGDLAPFLQLELKLIWRNKRPRGTVWLALMGLFYGLVIYPGDMPSMYIFGGVFLTGIFMINYGHFIPAWDAAYYPMMMSQNIPLRRYLRSKAVLMSLSVLLLTVLSTPYVLMGWEFLLINLAAGLYNIGINLPLLLYAGSFNRKRVDLEKSPMMNYQGMGTTQWVIAFPLLFCPLLLFWGISSFSSFETALLVLGLLGLLGILSREYLMDHIELAYRRRKYQTLQGFKEAGN